MDTSIERHHHPDMISVEEAREKILDLVHVLEPEKKPIQDAIGQVLVQDVAAKFDIPILDNSAMDGYAVQYDSIRGATEEAPKILQVIGQIAAGHVPTESVTPGTAARIMTGAPIPDGADTVIPFELTNEEEQIASGIPLNNIAVKTELRQGTHIRMVGEDVTRDAVMLTKGMILRSPNIGVLASLGYAVVLVHRRPVVAILATGDELTTPGQPLSPGKLYDTNSYAIAAAVHQCGGLPQMLGIAKDNMKDLHQKLETGLHADILITSAGVSKGAYDMVKDVIAERGKIAFWSVRMRPAKPLAFGLLRGKNGRFVPHLGLPGNPVSALVAFEELGRPALLKMMGRLNLRRPTVQAVLEDQIMNTDGRRVYARAIVTRRAGKYYARLAGPQGSHILTTMSKANALAICPEDVSQLNKGDVVCVRMLDWNEEVAL